MTTSAQRTALACIQAEVEAAKPDRAALEAFVRSAIETTPPITSLIGWHMQRDLTEALEKLLNEWGMNHGN